MRPGQCRGALGGLGCRAVGQGRIAPQNPAPPKLRGAGSRDAIYALLTADEPGMGRDAA